MNTIDTAIAAWKNATTQADRDLAAEAIEQHIAHDTPEGGDYEYATEELIDRLKAECGPLPEPDTRRFFIAVPAKDQGAGIYGIGTSEKAAWLDAWNGANAAVPTIEHVAGILDDSEMSWQVVNPLTGDTTECWSEKSAQRRLLETGFVARECTERLYDHIDDHGCDANSFRWDQSGALDDLYDAA